MTQRERYALMWAIDLIISDMGASGQRRFCALGDQSVRVIRRVLDVNPPLRARRVKRSRR
jgi:hypothetical protein